MNQIKVTLPDGRVKEYPKGVSLAEIARDAGKPDALVAKVDGELRDLATKLDRDARVEPLTFEQPEGREVYWHSSAHLLAQAVKQLFPEAKLAIGPPIDDGFYYDIDLGRPFAPEDLEKIEGRMRELAARDQPIERVEVPRDEAIRTYKEMGEKYKLELLESIPDPRVSFYRQDGFMDMCRGPHLPRTGLIKTIKLLSTSGAYWRGDEHREMLQRIYGISFPRQEQLDEFLRQLEEAKRRDHRRLGKDLKLFAFAEELGQGLPLWLPRGATVRRLLENYIVNLELQHGYLHVYAPDLASVQLYKISGHWDYFREAMYPPMKVDNDELSLHDPKDRQYYHQDEELWMTAEGLLHEVLRELGLTYNAVVGGANFYGPKLDVQVRTATGKEETLSTVQLDFLLPKRFELEFIGEDGKAHRPVMIHRAVISTMERMMAFLIEYYAGDFPVWLAPEQVRVLPIADRHLDYARNVRDRLTAAAVRVELDTSNERISYKVRRAQVDHVPYMLVVGDKEASSGQVAVRSRGAGDLGPIPLETFAARIMEEVAAKQ